MSRRPPSLAKKDEGHPWAPHETVRVLGAHVNGFLLFGADPVLRLFRVLMDERFDTVKFSDPPFANCGVDISVASDGFVLPQNEYTARIDSVAPDDWGSLGAPLTIGHLPTVDWSTHASDLCNAT